jgi:hypothetical protein
MDILNNKNMTLNELLISLENIGKTPEEFEEAIKKQENSALIKKAEMLFGNYAKAGVITGLDYMQIIDDKEKLRFYEQDIKRIFKDSSIGIDNKVKSLYNILCLGYFYIGKNDYEVKVSNKNPFKNPTNVKKDSFFENRLAVVFAQDNDNYSNSIVGIKLKKEIENSFNFRIFTYIGEEGVKAGLEFYNDISYFINFAQKTLNNIKK